MSNEILSQTYPKSDTLFATISTWDKDADCATCGRICLEFRSKEFRFIYSTRLTLGDAQALVEGLQAALRTCESADGKAVPA